MPGTVPGQKAGGQRHAQRCSRCWDAVRVCNQARASDARIPEAVDIVLCCQKWQLCWCQAAHNLAHVTGRTMTCYAHCNVHLECVQGAGLTCTSFQALSTKRPSAGLNTATLRLLTSRSARYLPKSSMASFTMEMPSTMMRGRKVVTGLQQTCVSR